MIAASAKDYDNKSGSIQIDRYPDDCPFCHRGMTPRNWGEMLRDGNQAQYAFMCPRRDCQKFFIAYYYQNPSGDFRLQRVSKVTAKPPTILSEAIQGMSAGFVKIFHEAEIAEQENLLEICG